MKSRKEVTEKLNSTSLSSIKDIGFKDALRWVLEQEDEDDDEDDD